MGFLTSILGTVVKTAVSPIAIVADVATGSFLDDAPTSTEKLADSIIEDIDKGFDDLSDGDIW